HLNYGCYPTPIEELPRLREALAQTSRSMPRLLIKRDDYTGPGFGGNKVRKLEYVLAQAITDGAEVAITIGGEKSNHARVTAALCARLGLRCILVLNAVEETARQLAAMNAHVDYIFHSSSSGGTQAGIVAGCQLFGPSFGLTETQVIGVSPDDPAVSISTEVARIIVGIGELLGLPAGA